MDNKRIWTAADLEVLSPDDRQRLFNAQVVSDLSTVDPVFLGRVRAKSKTLLEAREVIEPEPQ